MISFAATANLHSKARRRYPVPDLYRLTTNENGPPHRFAIPACRESTEGGKAVVGVVSAIARAYSKGGFGSDSDPVR